MKKIIIILTAWLPLITAAQVVFDFESALTDGLIFNLPGRWSADNANALSGSYSLHHVFDNPDAGTDFALFDISGLCTGCVETSWQFALRHGADPSSSNKWLFFLTSDKSFPDIVQYDQINGYAVGVNFVGYDDTLRLWHLKEGEFTALITTDINWQSNVGTDGIAEIIVVRKVNGEWLMEVDVSGVKRSWSGTELLMHKPLYSGIAYSYTSSRDRLLWIDDIMVDGIFIPDTLPPEVVSVTALAPDILQVVFTETPEETGLNPATITVSGGINIISVVKTGPEVYRLYIDRAIGNRMPSSITFSLLCDAAGNCETSKPVVFTPDYPETGDIVITEIMCDPLPPVYMPDAEYIEISNLYSDSLPLVDFILIANEDTVTIPPMWIKSGEEIILCANADTSFFSQYGRTTGIKSFPSLNDTGETLALRNGEGTMIHAVTYSPALYHDELRSGGGWSMEMTDTGNPFNEPDTWHASVDPSGGTPGKENSQSIPAPDSRCPEIIAVWPVTSDKVKLLADESILHAISADEWYIDGEKALFVSYDDIADRSLIIQGQIEFEGNKIHTLQIPDETVDFAGNRICVSDIRFGLPENPAAGDVLFNELLFDPIDPCPDYIELYNNSEKTTDLSKLFLSSLPEDGTKASVISAGDVPRQLLPREYVVLTTNKIAVAGTFICSNKEAIFEVAALPSMPDNKGNLALFNFALSSIDRVEYNSSLHMEFLSQTEGISLEKVNPSLSSEFSYNWHSASESCNWGSPGEPNSVFLPDIHEGDGLTLSSERVSPDGDGFEDVVSVNIIPGGKDNVITVIIFNDRGYPVRHLANRFFAGEGASFIWDGTADNSTRLQAGLYLIIAESYNTNGQTHRWKEVCAVLYR